MQHLSYFLASILSFKVSYNFALSLQTITGDLQFSIGIPVWLILDMADIRYTDIASNTNIFGISEYRLDCWHNGDNFFKIQQAASKFFNSQLVTC